MKTVYLPQIPSQINTKSVPVTLLNTECRGDLEVIIGLLVSLFVKRCRWHEILNITCCPEKLNFCRENLV